MSETPAVPPRDTPTVLILDTGAPARRFRNLIVRVRSVAPPPRNVSK
ncbi:hypothetical protein [Actinophytocola xanthii]|nr:hypothetical protein [Actinophytocola xanthii]